MRTGSLRGQQGQVRGWGEYTGSAKLKTKRGGGKGNTDQAEFSGLMGCRLCGRRGGLALPGDLPFTLLGQEDP